MIRWLRLQEQGDVFVTAPEEQGGRSTCHFIRGVYLDHLRDSLLFGRVVRQDASLVPVSVEISRSWVSGLLSMIAFRLLFLCESLRSGTNDLGA